MPAEEKTLEKDPQDPPELPEAAEQVIDAVKKALNERPAPEAKPSESSSPQEDPRAVYKSWQEEVKKKMGWNDEQLSFHEQSIRQAQAPLLKDNAILKIRTTKKDFDQLEKAFMSEVERYEKDFRRVIDSSLAEEIYYKVKGVEVDAGRYKFPDSQPKGVAESGISHPTARIARSYDGADPGTGNVSRETSSQSMSDTERDYLEFFQKCADQIGFEVTPESYVQMRQEKRDGKRSITDKAVRRMEVSAQSGAADRDLAYLINRNATVRVNA
jgi:hypothetical protein